MSLYTRNFSCETEAETTAMAQRLAAATTPTACILLEGPVGAGKSHFARGFIRSLLIEPEDIPSPTFTLVQTYDLDSVELWHCDLYRLTDPGEIDALGLAEAYEEAITLIEWPDRLGADLPRDALVVSLQSPETGQGRTLALTDLGTGWATRLAPCLDQVA